MALKYRKFRNTFTPTQFSLPSISCALFLHVARHGMRMHTMPRFAASFLNRDRYRNLFDSAEVVISVITAAIIII